MSVCGYSHASTVFMDPLVALKLPYNMAVSCGCWGLNPAPLPELFMLSITEPSFQLLAFSFKWFSNLPKQTQDPSSWMSKWGIFLSTYCVVYSAVCSGSSASWPFWERLSSWERAISCRAQWHPNLLPSGKRSGRKALVESTWWPLLLWVCLKCL